jgi:hypothetical protein
MPTRLPTRLLLDLRTVFDGSPDPICSIGLDGAIYAAAREASGYLVARIKGDDVRTLHVPEVPFEAAYVQPYPGGVLVAGARCRRLRPDGAEKNAIACDWTGRELARLTLGDGIADLRVTPAGVIWASYYDEGVLGNYGWGGRGHQPIGASGLAAFSSSGDIAYTYDATRAGTGSIIDAYAINVAGDDVWAYFYTEFPIVRFRRGHYTTWRTDVRYACALAVSRRRALLFGGYESRSAARILELGDDGAARVVETRVTTDDEGDELDRTHAWGIGARLYLRARHKLLVAEDW